MSRYTGVTDEDLRQMLDAIGVGSLEDLFADIPESVRLGRELDLPQGKAEQEVYEHLSALAARNRHSEEEVSFLGAGMYDHYVPAVTDMVALAPAVDMMKPSIQPRGRRSRPAEPNSPA